MRRRAGRPRRTDARRTPSGRISRAGALSLGPTAELLRWRRALVGRDGDHRMAESPLGVLLARDRITAEERDAGNRYAWLYRLCLGRTHLRANDPTMPQEAPGAAAGVPPLDEGKLAWLAAREADFDTARGDLKEQGEAVVALVVETAVFQSLPDWMGAERPLTRAEAQDLQCLRQGLQVLARRFGFATAKPETRRRGLG